MSARELTVDVLLAIAVAVCLLCAVGLFVFREVWNRLHLLGPAGTVGALCLFGAAMLKEGASSLGLVKPILLLLLFSIASPLITHAIARAYYFYEAEQKGEPPERRTS